MLHISIETGLINPDLLHQELKAALDDKVIGLSTNKKGTTIHMAKESIPLEIKIATEIVQRHDHTKETNEQEQTRAREARLKVDRLQYNGHHLYIDATPEQIIKKLNWLQDEIEQRGL